MSTPSGLADTCPRCAVGDAPGALPVATACAGDSIRAEYRCAACGCEWHTSWDARAAGWPVDRTEVPAQPPASVLMEALGE
jgi:hypothetical protein